MFVNFSGVLVKQITMRWRQYKRQYWRDRQLDRISNPIRQQRVKVYLNPKQALYRTTDYVPSQGYPKYETGVEEWIGKDTRGSYISKKINTGLRSRAYAGKRVKTRYEYRRNPYWPDDEGEIDVVWHK